MKDIPILFSGQMVRSILDGRKKQTRRTDFGVKIEQQVNDRFHVYNAHGGCFDVAEEDVGRVAADYARYTAGDRLWVRENCKAEELPGGLLGVRYAADDAFLPISNTKDAAEKWVSLYNYRYRFLKGAPVPSIHMPRWASRLTLIVESVKVERLQQISENDALAEGAFKNADGLWTHTGDLAASCPVMSFRMMWCDLYGNDSWFVENPWVAAITFCPIRANIDSEEAKAASAS